MSDQQCPLGGKDCPQVPRIEQHFETVAEMQKTLVRIESALLGDPKMRLKGALQRIDEHEVDISNLKGTRLQIIAYTAGAGGVILLLWEIAKPFLR